jgi:5-hydroxyisourate hydrolase-like protein (transthyretin family)
MCPRCKKEGHVARACSDSLPWECIAPFCGLAAPELGFHIIQDDEYGDPSKETTNLAVITIKEGEVTARQVEGEFRAQDGQASTWRWYAKKISEGKFQMKFPTANKVEELTFFNGMEMRTVPGLKFKVDKWNPHVGAKAEIAIAWFRISGIPTEKRT